MISALMLRNIPPKVVAEMVFFGDRMTVSEAHDHGIINRIESAEKFSATVDRCAGQIASKSPLMLKLGKEALFKQRDLSLDAAMSLMQHYLTLAQNTEDNKEGVAAFMEKRDPVWKGR
jgi:enoyl-CoA hydratase/carnithine racemase